MVDGFHQEVDKKERFNTYCGVLTVEEAGFING